MPLLSKRVSKTKRSKGSVKSKSVFKRENIQAGRMLYDQVPEHQINCGLVPENLPMETGIKFGPSTRNDKYSKVKSWD